jgi:hypothetical protein
MRYIASLGVEMIDDSFEVPLPLGRATSFQVGLNEII